MQIIKNYLTIHTSFFVFFFRALYLPCILKLDDFLYFDLNLNLFIYYRFVFRILTSTLKNFREHFSKEHGKDFGGPSFQ